MKNRIEKSKILMAVDDVVVKDPYLKAINAFKGTSYSLAGVDNYYLQDEFLEFFEREKFSKYLVEHDIYENCELEENAREIMEILSWSLEIYPFSSCIIKYMENKCGVIFANKYNFLMREFPFLDPKKIIFTEYKNIFKGFDYQVDDKIDNMCENVKHKFLFTRWHNKNISDEELEKLGIIRVDSWIELLENIFVLEGSNKQQKYWKNIIFRVIKLINI